jgi:hypothetical protein
LEQTVLLPQNQQEVEQQAEATSPTSSEEILREETLVLCDGLGFFSRRISLLDSAEKEEYSSTKKITTINFPVVILFPNKGGENYQ